MKPKEFIKKFGLQNGWKSKKQNEFLGDMTSELLALLEINHAEGNIKGFENSVNVIRMKWDSISNKIPYGLPDKLWNYFFATVISKLRDELCPEEMEIRREDARKRKEAYEERKRMREEYEDFFGDWFRFDYNRFIHDLFKSIIESTPINEFSLLGLTENATAQEVKEAYRKLSLKTHPDKGGDKERFIQITEAKNKCLAWLQK